MSKGDKQQKEEIKMNVLEWEEKLVEYGRKRQRTQLAILEDEKTRRQFEKWMKRQQVKEMDRNDNQQ